MPGSFNHVERGKTFKCTTTPGGLEVPRPSDENPLPHQLEALDFLSSRRRAYYAADPGLGKTVVAALLANLKQAHVFYVTPPFLAENVDVHFDTWAKEKRLTIIKDSMIHKQRSEIDFQLSAIPDDVETILVVDEAHRMKETKAIRSTAVYSMLHKFDRVLFMSGTPMPNSRPIELYPACKALAPKEWPENRFEFGRRYCGAYKTSYGWKFDGATNVTEFKMRLFRTFMLRQKKANLVLPKMEGLLTVGESMPPVISKFEKKILDHYTKSDLAYEKILSVSEQDELHTSTYLKLLGSYKLKFVTPYVESLLEESNEPLILFGIHKDVIAELAKHFADYDPIVITGDVPPHKRQALVDEFQKNPKRKLFIGNIQACGTGFTMTRCNRAIFVEFSWVDGENTQAGDRIHRIGQTKNVSIQYVVLKDSFDSKRMNAVLKKRKNQI